LRPRNPILLLALAGCLTGCAVQRGAVKPAPVSSPAPPPPKPPVLTQEQLLGFKRPDRMIQDPVSGKYAMKEVMEAYWKLKERAAQDGWHLILASGYRSFYAQRQIWNRYEKEIKLIAPHMDEKTRVRAIMSVVSVPGLSRHHWGTELDISENSLQGRLTSVTSDTPRKVLDYYAWMEEYAPQFGFCKVYEGKRGAVMDEPWHWSYLPFSTVYQRQFLGITDFRRILDVHVGDVQFLMKNLPRIIKKEIGSINPQCQVQTAPAVNPSGQQPTGAASTSGPPGGPPE
jgi:LAS superfamily LD-carboxypeptidase LdcB